MRVLVTGAGGFIGSAAAGRLLDLGHDVVGVDCLLGVLHPAATTRERLAGLDGRPGFRLERLDLRQDALGHLLDDVDVVVNEAALPGLELSWTEFRLYQDSNLLVVQRLLEEVRRHPRVHLVQASTSSVYGRFACGDESLPTVPTSPYGVTKLAAEHLIGAYRDHFGVSSTVLRYFSVYGPGQRPDMAYARFCRQLLRDETLLVTGDGSQLRSNTYIDDVVAATVAACELRPAGEVLNICGGTAVSVLDAVAVLADELGVAPRVEHVAPRIGDQVRTEGDANRARHVLGWRPTFDLDEGLRRQARQALADAGAVVR